MKEIPQNIDVNEVLQRNADKYGVTVQQIQDKSRNRSVDVARNNAHFELREANLTFKEIGRLTNRHWTTIINNVYHGPKRLEDIKKRPKKEKVPKKIISELELALLTDDYIDTNFPHLSIEDLRSNSRFANISIPRQALIRHLYYDKGAKVMQIANGLSKDHSSIVHAISLSEDKFQAKMETWTRIREKEVRLSSAKEAKKINDKETIAKKLRDEVFAKSAVKLIARHYGVSVDHITSKSKKKSFTQPRKTSTHIIKEGTDWTWQKIANFHGKSDHSTAINAYETVDERLGHDEEYAERYTELNSRINKLTERFLKRYYADVRN